MEYLNSILLFVTCSLAIMIFVNQSDTSKELIRLKTNQDRNIGDVEKLGNRVLVLERDNISSLQKWVDENYIRKPQD